MYNPDEAPDFSKPWLFSDVVFAVEERKFHVHKSTLSMWSPVFEKMFTSDFSEKEAREIPLPGKCADEIEILLKLVYTHGKNPQVSGILYVSKCFKGTLYLKAKARVAR